MITKNKIRWMPPLKQLQDAGINEHGWLVIDGKTLEVTNIHHYDDYGQEVETFTLEDGQEVYTFNEGETFTFDIE